jgi:DNA-binding MarR family transcriptional regulator
VFGYQYRLECVVTLATELGLDASAVARQVAAMAKAGLVRRHGRQ